MISKCHGAVGQIGSAMPARKVVTNPPSASKHVVAITVRIAQTCSQRGTGRIGGRVVIFSFKFPLSTGIYALAHIGRQHARRGQRQNEMDEVPNFGFRQRSCRGHSGWSDAALDSLVQINGLLAAAKGAFGQVGRAHGSSPGIVKIACLPSVIDVAGNAADRRIREQFLTTANRFQVIFGDAQVWVVRRRHR